MGESREKNSKLEGLGKNSFLNTSVLKKNFDVNARVFRKKHLFFRIFRYFDKNEGKSDLRFEIYSLSGSYVCNFITITQL